MCKTTVKFKFNIRLNADPKMQQKMYLFKSVKFDCFKNLIKIPALHLAHEIMKSIWIPHNFGSQESKIISHCLFLFCEHSYIYTLSNPKF